MATARPEQTSKATAPSPTGMSAACLLEVQDVVCAERHTLVLTGELDLASAPMLEAAVARICASGAGAVVLDLRSLTFMDCAGIRAILRAQERCRAEEACWFGVVPGVQRQVGRLLELTGVLSDVSGPRSGPTAPAPPKLTRENPFIHSSYGYSWVGGGRRSVNRRGASPQAHSPSNGVT